MYLPRHFAEEDLATLHALVHAHPLGTWVTRGADGPDSPAGIDADHVPFMLDTTRGPLGTLRAHVARANPLWRSMTGDGASASLVIFQGADAYISPSWYPGKHADGKAVPTWNYAVVHVRGTPCAIEDKATLLGLVSSLTHIHEGSQRLPWKVTDAPADYIDKLLGAIVGIEIPIDSIVGKWKVSQNHPKANKLGVVAGLGQRGRAGDDAMATMVERFVEPPKT
jgi:transcriptional regulator